MIATKTAGQFAARAAEALSAAKDLHLTLEVDGKAIPTHRRTYRLNVRPQTLARIVPQWREASARVCTGRFADGIGYIAIHSWSRKDIETLKPALQALRSFADAKGIILDVRRNGGGSEVLATDFAGRFIEKPAVYARHVTRAPAAPGGFTRPRDRTLSPMRVGPRYRGRVAVLMGPANVSSCEAFLLMMNQVPGCSLFGATSGGSSGNPQPVALGNGVTVMVPSWKAMRPDGSVFEGEGIAPTVRVPAAPKDLLTGDPVLAAALKYLRQP